MFHYIRLLIHLQVVLEDEQTEQQGEEIAKGLMKKLDISESDLVTNAYIDLLLKNESFHSIAKKWQNFNHDYRVS